MTNPHKSTLTSKDSTIKASVKKVLPRVLVVDDEPDLRELLELTLLRMGLEVELVGTVAAAREKLQNQTFNLCLTDMRLPDGLGIEIVTLLSQRQSPIPVAVITAFGSTDNAVAALKAGAFDYLSKPLELNALRELVKNALRLPKATAHTHSADDASAQPIRAVLESGLSGISPAIQEVRQTIFKLVRSVAPVAITGESGVGKELAARLIHQTSVRRDGAFLAVNCGAIPENLMEAEFFGYRKGAFTGADTERDGFFQAAHGGTLFLDEVADLPLAMQVKLLRVIQERQVRKIGATQEEPVDVRIISATHKDLAGCVAAGTLRQDLFYRLNVISLRMPTLRERVEDIPILAEELLARIAQRNQSTGQTWPCPRLTEEAQTALQHYAFPGNVRELENILERAFAFASFEPNQTEFSFSAADLALEDELEVAAEATVESPSSVSNEMALPPDLNHYLDQVERDILLKALAATADNRTAAAKLLGISFRQMRYRLQRLGI